MKFYAFIFKVLVMVALGFINNSCLAEWPKIASVTGKEIFKEPAFAKFSKTILDEDGRALYELTCKNGDMDDDEDFNYSGLFHCRLSIVGASKSDSHSLLFEGRTATSDWDGRARFLLNDVLGACGAYSDWGSVRTFLVRGMRIILKIRNVVLINESGEPKAKSFSFFYELKPDKLAKSELAKISPTKEPPWFNGGAICLHSH
ncbi:hypothetical protein [Undibacterium sp. Ji22W]|uniref:hypothetical protein n=1 Tax=Undibacterium sp. Ji22W TaxID=3413038 RepID=UPI003BF3215A